MKFYFVLLGLTLHECVITNHLSLLFHIRPCRVHQIVCIVVGGTTCVVLELTLHHLPSNYAPNLSMLCDWLQWACHPSVAPISHPSAHHSTMRTGTGYDVVCTVYPSVPHPPHLWSSMLSK
jgi:hypothetical protein